MVAAAAMSYRKRFDAFGEDIYGKKMGVLPRFAQPSVFSW
jgi:hypothetical protein